MLLYIDDDSVDRVLIRGLTVSGYNTLTGNHREPKKPVRRKQAMLRGLKARRFIALKMWIVSRKEKGLQAVCLIHNCIWHTASLNCQEINQTINSVDHFAMNEWITADCLNILASTACERCEFRGGIFPLIRESYLKRDPPLQDFLGETVFF